MLLVLQAARGGRGGGGLQLWQSMVQGWSIGPDTPFVVCWRRQLDWTLLWFLSLMRTWDLWPHWSPNNFWHPKWSKIIFQKCHFFGPSGTRGPIFCPPTGMGLGLLPALAK